MDKQEVLEQCARDSVAFVRLQFTEPYGAVKNVSIPVDELEKALDNELMFDGSSIRGFKRIEQSDMYFLPDPSTYAVLPWRGTEAARTARLICDVADPDGQPFAGDPRTNLRRVLKEAADLGYTMNVGPEAEFFLFKLDGDGNPTVDPHDAATYFDVAPIDRGEDCRRDIEVTLQQMGFELEAAHHEVAIGQHEIDFRHGDALATADNLITFRLVVKTIAARHGMHATFMAKPIHGENGSGMHINQSLARGDENAFLDAGDDLQLSTEARRTSPASSSTSPRSPRSPTRPSTRTSGCCPATRRRCTSPGRPATALPPSASPPSAAARRGSSCERRTRPRTRTWRSPACWRRASTGSSAA